MSNRKQERHILALSGGKDSAALAVYMRDKYPEMCIRDRSGTEQYAAKQNS